MTDQPAFAPIPAVLPSTVPFVGPEQIERETGRLFRARLGANELTLPPSPKVVEACTRVAQTEAAYYPDPTAFALRERLATHTGLAPENILVGEGIDALLGWIVRLFMAPGDVAVTSLGAYPTFNYHVAGAGARIETIPYRDDAEDPAALAARVRETNAKLVYFCNPDNPMGSWHDAAAVEVFIDSIPDTCLVLLDEAYAEFAPRGVVPTDSFERPNLIRLRTFSKAYGLAGLRVGYAIAPPRIITGFDKIRNHFGVSRLAQAAALAALEDQTHMNQTVATIAKGRERLASIARANGLTPLPSATNFVTMDCGQDGAFAKGLLDEIVARQVFIRMPGPEGLNRCIRVSVGRDDELDLFEAVLPKALAQQGDPSSP